MFTKTASRTTLLLLLALLMSFGCSENPVSPSSSDEDLGTLAKTGRNDILFAQTEAGTPIQTMAQVALRCKVIFVSDEHTPQGDGWILSNCQYVAQTSAGVKFHGIGAVTAVTTFKDSLPGINLPWTAEGTMNLAGFLETVNGKTGLRANATMSLTSKDLFNRAPFTADAAILGAARNKTIPGPQPGTSVNTQIPISYTAVATVQVNDEAVGVFHYTATTGQGMVYGIGGMQFGNVSSVGLTNWQGNGTFNLQGTVINSRIGPVLNATGQLSTTLPNGQGTKVLTVDPAAIMVDFPGAG